MESRPDFVCGTRRAVTRGPSDHRVVCATCKGGGSTRYRTREAACKAAVAQSARPCTVKGCNAR